MKKIESNKIVWEKTYDQYFSILSLEYIDAKCYYTDENFQLRKEDKTIFLERTKRQFLENIQKIKPFAFNQLHKRLPLLAEHIIIHCYKNKILKDEEFAEIFLDIYVHAKKDLTLFSTFLNYDELLYIFKNYKKKITLDKEDIDYFETLPTKIQIFRGTAGKSKKNAEMGISWTLNRDIAIGFGEFNKNCYETKSYLLIEGTILKKDIIIYAHNSGLSEYEVIIDPSNVFNLKYLEFENTEEDLLADFDGIIPEQNYSLIKSKFNKE